MANKPSFAEISVDTQVLIRRLLTVEVGETVSYDELSQLIGREVDGDARHLLSTARRRLERDEQVLFAPVMGVGLKRLDSAGVISEGQRSLTHIRKTARTTARRLATCVTDYDALPDGQKRDYNMTVAQTGVLVHLMKPSTVKKLEPAINTQADAATAKFLEAVRQTV